jgi:predicted RNA binding protein YcfA (HicA-like mRNA interferase family)
MMCKKDNPTQLKTGTELVRYAESHGGEICRQSGSHAIVKGPSGGICPVPVHAKDLPTGTRCSILKTFKAIGILMVLAFCVYAFWPLLQQVTF